MDMQDFYYQIKQESGIMENFHVFMDSDYFLEFYSDMLNKGHKINPLLKEDFKPLETCETYSYLPLKYTGTELEGFIEHYQFKN